VSPELQPYVVYRLRDGEIECAVWQLQEGPKALALFLSGDAATAYRDNAHGEPAWRVFRPAREGLLQLLRACYEAGIRHAVLDPDREKAKLIFDLHEILAAAGGQ
jgi:hypothetical protein